MRCRLFLLMMLAMLAACTSIGDRDNPTDPVAANYNPAMVYGDPNSSASSAGKAVWSYLNFTLKYGEVFDSRDFQTYRSILIGGRQWLAENINFKKAGGLCYDEDSTLCVKYGRLYTYKEAVIACPDGFHLPTKAEWNALPDADALISSKGWYLDDGRSGGTNASGLTVLPSGRYTEVKGVDSGFVNLANAAYMWTSTNDSNDSAYAVLISSRPERWIKKSPKKDRYSVRCVADDTTKFVQTSSSSMKMPDTTVKSSSSKAKSSSSGKSSTSSSSTKRAVKSPLPCGDLWCGPELDYYVHTGFGDGKDSSEGVWYYYLDDGNGGTSYFSFPAKLSGPNIGFEAVIDSCGGICGTAHVETGYEYPYLGLSFLIKDNPEKMVDITSWGGICLSYTSNEGFFVALHPNDSIQAVMEYDDYVYAVSKSEGGNVVDIPWSKFNQLGWGAKYDRTKLLKQVSSIVALMVKDRASGERVDFNIVSIGKLGTCTRF